MSDEIFKAFIGGLPYDSLASDIETLLTHCKFTEEEIRKFEIHLVHDRESGNFKGFAYVTFENEQQLNNAIEKLNGAAFEQKTLKVNRAQQRERGGRGGGRGNFSGDRGSRGGRSGGFRRGGGGRFNDGENRSGFSGGENRSVYGGGGNRGYRQEFGSSKNQDGLHAGRHHHQSDGETAPTAPPSERPRLNLKPRTTDAAEIEARKKQEEEETKRRQEKLFQ